MCVGGGGGGGRGAGGRGGANEQNNPIRRILFPIQSHTLYLNILFPC